MSFIKSSKDAYKQVIKEVLDREHFDNEISMARSQLEAIADKSTALSSLLKTKKEGLEAWVQYKINQAKDDITGVHDYMVYTPGLNESLEIKETSISDIHKMKEDGKSSEEIAKELKLNPGLVKRILGEEVELKEIELKEFTDAEIAQLKKEFDPLKGKQISTARANQLSNILNKLDDGSLDKLKSALIPFVSAVAASKITQRKFRGVKITNIKVPGYTVEETIKEANEVDFVKIDIPLFIRLLEFAREDAKKDLDLHYLTTNLLKMKDKVASMPDYEKIVKMPVKEDVTADNINAKQKLKVLAGIEDVKKNTDTAEIGSIAKEEVLPERKITGTVNLVKEDEEFKPHDMYDPKTGEKQHVTTYAKHLELKNKGWGHEAPKKEQVKEVKNCGCGQTPCITYGTQNIDKTVEEASSFAQQAAIAIAKKKSGKYDKDGKRIKYEGAKALVEAITALQKKAEKSGMPYSILKQVYDRGMAAWKGGHRPGAEQHQWAFARVNSFVTKSSGTWGGADSDLAKKVKGKE